MKNVLLSVFFALLIVACVAKEVKKKKKESCCSSKETSVSYNDKETSKSCCSKSSDSAVFVATVDDLLANPQKFINKKVELSGLVVYTCKETGKNMFLAGNNDSIYINILASEKVNKFESKLKGSKVTVSGIISITSLNNTKHKEGEHYASKANGNGLALTCEQLKTL